MSNQLIGVAKASVRSTFSLFVGKTSSTIIMAVASVLLARLLGPGNYGLYSLALMVPSVLIGFASLGISPALTRFSARFHSRRENTKLAGLIKTGLVVRLVSSLLMTVILLLFSESIAALLLKRPEIGLLIRLTCLYLIGLVLFDTFNSIFIGLDKAEKTGLLMNVQAVSKTFTSLLLVILGMGAIGAILGTGMSFLLASGIGFVILSQMRQTILYSNGKNIDFFPALRMMILYGMPLYFSNIIGSAITQFQIFILALFASDIEIGNYRITMNFVILIALLAYPVQTSLFPAFSKLSIKDSKDAVEKVFKLSVKYASLILIPTSLAVAVLSKEAVHTLFGPQYEFAPLYLILYMLSFLYTGLGLGIIGPLFNSQGDTKIALKISILDLVISIPLGFVLTYLYGVPGFIYSILISLLVSVVFSLFMIRKKYAITVDMASCFKIVVASLLSALLVYIFITFVPIQIRVLRLVLGGFLYISSFLVFVPLIGIIDKEDVEKLGMVMKDLALVYPVAKFILNFEEKILSARSQRLA